MIAYLLAAAMMQPTGSPPADRPPYQVHGIGGSQCTGWTQARLQPDSVESAARVSWLAGFISAHNALLGVLENQSDLLGGSSLGEAATWIDAYCRGNPGADLHYAAQELVGELLERSSPPESAAQAR